MLETIAKYIYTVYRLKSVSLAAQELYVSQPALSRAIKKAETQMGIQIFNRKTIPLSITPEGKLYIDAIEKMLQIEKETNEKISDISRMHSGTLRIATSTHLSFYAIPKILKEFHKAHPKVDIQIIITDTDKLYEHLEKDTADLIFISEGQHPDAYCAVKLLEEQFVVAMPRYMVTKDLAPYSIPYDDLISGTYSVSQRITDMSLFHGIEFIYSPPNSNIQKKRKILFGKSDIPPYITSNAGRQQFNYNLMCSGFGALFTTDANIATLSPNSNCMYFLLGGSSASQSFSLVYSKKSSDPLYRLLQEFIGTSQRFFSGEMPLKQLNCD